MKQIQASFETLSVCELHPNKLKIAHININPIRKKLDLFSDQVKGNADFLMISETKIDESFPVSQFKIDGLNTPFWVDTVEEDGSMMIYVREDPPANFRRLIEETIVFLLSQISSVQFG